MSTPESAQRDMHAGPLATGRRIGRYEVLCQLASGGMATVYAARVQGVAGFERLVAIKALHPHLANEEEFISMFLDEARLAARIRHPNVVATHDIVDDEGEGHILVMDYIEGNNLGSLLQTAARTDSRIPTSVSMRTVIDALHGLAAAHALRDDRGVPLHLVHRDVSPQNIMVGVDGIGRLTDFGVAKAEVRLSITRDGQFKGKVAYMAPEQATNGEADQRSDLFAMGVILWEALTGRRLFRADNNAATIHRILEEPIPSPSSVFEELQPFDALLERALARNPAERFQTAEEFAEALEALAPAVGGIGTARAVGDVVRRLSAPRLAKEKGRIEQALMVLGRTELSDPQTPSHSGSRARRTQDDTARAALPDASTPQNENPRSRAQSPGPPTDLVGGHRDSRHRARGLVARRNACARC
jgi:serine/threonine protein kinase